MLNFLVKVILINGKKLILKQKFVYKTQLMFNGKTFNVNGFLDTGNVLFDGDAPVIVCGKKLFLQILGDDVVRAKLKKLEISTVNGQSPSQKLFSLLHDFWSFLPVLLTGSSCNIPS